VDSFSIQTNCNNCGPTTTPSPLTVAITGQGTKTGYGEGDTSNFLRNTYYKCGESLSTTLNIETQPDIFNIPGSSPYDIALNYTNNPFINVSRSGSQILVSLTAYATGTYSTNITVQILDSSTGFIYGTAQRTVTFTLNECPNNERGTCCYQSSANGNRACLENKTESECDNLNFSTFFGPQYTATDYTEQTVIRTPPPTCNNLQNNSSCYNIPTTIAPGCCTANSVDAGVSVNGCICAPGYTFKSCDQGCLLWRDPPAFLASQDGMEKGVCVSNADIDFYESSPRTNVWLWDFTNCKYKCQNGQDPFGCNTPNGPVMIFNEDNCTCECEPNAMQEACEYPSGAASKRSDTYKYYISTGQLLKPGATALYPDQPGVANCTCTCLLNPPGLGDFELGSQARCNSIYNALSTNEKSFIDSLTYDASECICWGFKKGACCNPNTGVCNDGKTRAECTAPNVWHPLQLCSDLNPSCGGTTSPPTTGIPMNWHLGSCCKFTNNTSAGCEDFYEMGTVQGGFPAASASARASACTNDNPCNIWSYDTCSERTWSTGAGPTANEQGCKPCYVEQIVTDAVLTDANTITVTLSNISRNSTQYNTNENINEIEIELVKSDENECCSAAQINKKIKKTYYSYHTISTNTTQIPTNPGLCQTE
jgi:hypothetical protein